MIAVNVIFAQNQGILYSFYALALRAYFLFLSHRKLVLVFSRYRSITFFYNILDYEALVTTYSFCFYCRVLWETVNW